MQNVGDICLGGTRYGYIHEPKNTKNLARKTVELQEFGCANIICDVGVGNRENLDKLLEKANFRDHILFYDHSAFQTVDELYDVFDLSIGPIEGSPGFAHDFFNDTDASELAHTPEDTAMYRKRHARRRRFNVALNWFFRQCSIKKTA